MLGLSTCGALFLCTLQVWERSAITKTEMQMENLYLLNQADYFKDLDPNKPTKLNGRPHYIQGIRQPGDSLLKGWYLQTDKRRVRRVSEDISFPDIGGNITSIDVINMTPYGKGGYVTFTKGGVGHNHATIRFRPRCCEGFHYYVVFYGIRD